MTNFDCKDIKAILSGMVDGEVDTATRHMAERHLADCKACRELLNEAERVNEMVALEAQRLLWPVGLPAGFEEAVLSRTAYAEAYNFAGRRWTSWLGWVAAAASLLLALSIWMLDRRELVPAQPLQALNQPRLSSSSMANASYLRSWTSEAALPAEGFERAVLTSGTLDEATQRDIDEQLALVQPAMYRPRSALSRDDADTLYSASTLLEMLAQADLTSFADVERIRRIAEYDNMLARLAEVRGHVSLADRPLVIAAESVLLRIVNGPLDSSDLEMLNDTVSRLDLATELEDISGIYASSL
jgi:predicted anti-sigma-YlaC factor YlaD